MGDTLYQPAPSPGRRPVDAPKRYGWDAPVRSTSRAARLQLAVLGPRPERAGCFVQVLAFYFVSYLGLRSIARPWGSSREPCRPLLSALSPRDRRAPCCCGLPHPRRTQRPVPPGTATARLAVWPSGPGMCVQDRARPPPFGASREQRCPVRVRFSEEPCARAGARTGVLPSRAERLGGSALFSSIARFGFGSGRMGSAETVGKRRKSFVVRAGLGWALRGACKLVIALAPRAPCHLVIIPVPAAAGTRGSGLCLPRSGLLLGGAALPPWAPSLAAAPGQ